MGHSFWEGFRAGWLLGGALWFPLGTLLAALFGAPNWYVALLGVCAGVSVTLWQLDRRDRGRS